MIVTTYTGLGCSETAPCLLEVAFGNGDGTFATPIVSSLPGAFGIGAADLNGDGFADLLITTSSATSVMLGRGDGTFTAGQSFALAALLLRPRGRFEYNALLSRNKFVFPTPAIVSQTRAIIVYLTLLSIVFFGGGGGDEKRIMLETIVRLKKNWIGHMMRGGRANERSYGEENGGKDGARPEANVFWYN